MLTSALAGLLLSGNAIAQTTISGELRVSLKATEAKVPSGTTTTGSKRGFGNEQQINFATKGKLNVGGLDYAAGFSIENDGTQATTIFNENTYMDIINASSGTTLSLGLDHIQRSDTDRSAAVLVGFSPNELSTDGHTVTRFRQNLGPAVSQGMGIAVLQTIPNGIGTLSYNYVPSTVNQSTTAANTGSSDSERLSEADQESGYEYGFTGGLGVKGLNTYYFKSAAKKEVGATTKAEAKSWGANYNFGQFTVGYADKTHNLGTSSPTATNVGTAQAAGEHKEKHYGAAYAVNKDMTVGLLYAKAEVAGSTVETKLKGINIGYNLGPVNATIGYAKTAEVNGIAGNDVEVGMIRLIGAF